MRSEKQNPDLQIRQHTLDKRFVGRMDLFHSTQLTLTLGRLLGQDVATERLLVLEAISSLLEALGSAAVAFDFRHEENSARYFLENPGPTTSLTVAR